MENSSQPIEELITLFLERKASEEQLKVLDAWLKADKANRRYFDEINNRFQTSVTLRHISSKTDDAWSKFSHRITSEERGQVIRPASLSFKPLTVLKIAASVCFILLSGFLLTKFVFKRSATEDVAVQNIKETNRRIALPDGSVVWLNTNSIIEYPSSFGNTSRIVSLKGEAFFDIKKSSKAFIVTTDNLQIHVKGTKFNVQAYKNEPSVQTTLEEGKVELHLKGTDEFYIMEPGDQITLDKDLNNVTVKKVDPDNFTAWKEEQLVFDNTPLGDVIAKLENRYRANISAAGIIASRERLTMTIEDESLDEALELIQLSSHLKMKKEKNQIILYE